MRFPIWSMMVAVAVMALPFALLDKLDASALAAMLVVVALPIACAPPRHRANVTCWVVALHPLMILVYLYATWFTAWVVLGHCPRSSLDDPKTISPIVMLPYVMTILAFLAWPFSVATGIVFACVSGIRRSSDYPTFVLPWVWMGTFFAIRWAPFHVLVWFMD